MAMLRNEEQPRGRETKGEEKGNRLSGLSKAPMAQSLLKLVRQATGYRQATSPTSTVS